MNSRTQEITQLQKKLARDLPGHFETVVIHFQDPLYAFARGMCRCPHDAEEIVQDTFVRAFRALSTYEADRIEALSLQAWLYRICLNLSRNRARINRPITDPLDENRAPGNMEETRDPVAHGYETGERAEEVRQHLHRLAPRYRSPLVLRYVNDLSYEEIADALGQPVGTVKSNIHRGIAHLRTSFGTEDKGRP